MLSRLAWSVSFQKANKLTSLPKPNTTTIRASHSDNAPEYFVVCIGHSAQWIVENIPQVLTSYCGITCCIASRTRKGPPRACSVLLQGPPYRRGSTVSLRRGGQLNEPRLRFIVESRWQPRCLLERLPKAGKRAA